MLSDASLPTSSSMFTAHLWHMVCDVVRCTFVFPSHLAHHFGLENMFGLYLFCGSTIVVLNISAVGRCALWLASCLTSTFFLLARLPSGALVQRCILCCVFREGVVNSFASRRKNLISVPLHMLANSGFIQVNAANREVCCTWFVLACATDASFFFFVEVESYASVAKK